MNRLVLTVALSLALTSVASASESSPSTATAAPKVYKNCKALNARYPHGVGKAKARDKTTGTPVATFLRNTKLYLANKGRDRDGDGIACEKA